MECQSPARERGFATLEQCGCNSVVECQLPKLNVAGSSPVTRLPSTIERRLKQQLLLAARFNQLQHLRTHAAGATLAIERLQD